MNPDLDLLKGVGHHGDEHVDENDDGHCLVGHEQHLAHKLRERLAAVHLDVLELRHAEQRPVQRPVAVLQPDTNRLFTIRIVAGGQSKQKVFLVVHIIVKLFKRADISTLSFPLVKSSVVVCL